METLNSFSHCSGASRCKRRPLSLKNSATASKVDITSPRSGRLLLRRPGFKTEDSLFKYDARGRSFICRSFPCHRVFAVQFLKGKGEHSFANTQSAAGRNLPVVFHLKAAFTAFTVLLPAVSVTLLQTILAQRANATVQAAAQNGGRLLSVEIISSAWTGFFAGCLHTLSGPDHLAALAPLSIGRTRIESAIVGALWGCGHDAGQMVFGLLFLLLKDRLHIEIIRTWGTRVVGTTLLIIGALGIREASEVTTPCAAHENGETASSGRKKIGFATFATGIIHGLQPDALMMILPAVALPSRLSGAAFLGMFLFGTVLAMSAYTVFICSCSQALKERVPRITEKLTWAASLLAIVIGLAILLSQLFGFSLY